ncbi:hypothetical protein RvY_07340 [Ramazzottius varieornatus]|uniref:Uncharacterized protein n=1 Tax=Ramazzottius varieornatus TaxID=947166 RepID=A0A1D1VA96_RAMVA|nr:hypothetical protein RvY_07340 [Ramazzottius varieornatus]
MAQNGDMSTGWTARTLTTLPPLVLAAIRYTDIVGGPAILENLPTQASARNGDLSVPAGQTSGNGLSGLE